MLMSRFYFTSPAKKLNAQDIEKLVKIISTVDTAAFLIDHNCIQKNDPDILKNLVQAVQDKNIATLIADDVVTMSILQADGVQIGADVEGFKSCRKALGDDFIIGAYAGSSKHDAMLFGELDADYVAFGADSSEYKNQDIINLTLWWQDVFKPPAIAYLNATENVDDIVLSDKYPDFVALLPNFWEIDKPEKWLQQLSEKLSCD